MRKRGSKHLNRVINTPDVFSVGFVNSPLGRIGILCSEAGVVSVSLPGDEASWLKRLVPRYAAAGTMSDTETLRFVARTAGELTAYFDGTLRAFTIPLDARGTPFQQQVWQAVCAVPFGETISYGEIARRIGRPNTARAVGHANGSNRLPIIVPCHRLVGSSGGLTGYAGGLPMKRSLIDHERRLCDNAGSPLTAHTF